MALRDKFDGTAMVEDGFENNPKVSRQALAALHDSAFGWALSLTQYDAQAAEEVMQQAYLALLDGSARFAGDASLKTWLFAVVRNTTHRYWRTQQQQRGLADRLQHDHAALPETVQPTDKLNSDQVAPLLRNAMIQLPERQRQVLELVVDAEFSLEQVAIILGISVGSARTHYHRAKQTLRSQLQEMKELKENDDHRQ